MPQAPTTPDSSVSAASPTGLRERNVEGRRQQILQAARVLLSRGGLGALSMRKLAEEASLSVNTLYNLWGTREEILRALTLDARSRMDATISTEPAVGDPVERCRAGVGAAVRAMCQEHDLFRPMTLAWLEGEIAGRPSPVEPMAQSIQAFAQIIHAAREDGFLECPMKPEQIAWQIQHGVQFALVQWALGRIDDVHFEARALYSVNLAFLGLVHPERQAEIRTRLKGLERKLRPVSEGREKDPE